MTDLKPEQEFLQWLESEHPGRNKYEHDSQADYETWIDELRTAFFAAWNTRAVHADELADALEGALFGLLFLAGEFGWDGAEGTAYVKDARAALAKYNGDRDMTDLKPCPKITHYLTRMDDELLARDGSAEISHEEAKQALRDVYLISCGKEPEFHKGRLLGVSAPKVKPLPWQREPGGSYVWPLGMHYYTEESDGRWSTSAMICNDELWNGGSYPTRHQAEIAMQHHFNEQVAEWLPTTPETET